MAFPPFGTGVFLVFALPAGQRPAMQRDKEIADLRAPSVASTAARVAFCTSVMWAAIWPWRGRSGRRDFTSPATPAKPCPASPARAASMVALGASRLVCDAMPLISSATWPTRSPAMLKVAMRLPASAACATASRLIWADAPNWVPTSLAEAVNRAQAELIASIVCAIGSLSPRPSGFASRIAGIGAPTWSAALACGAKRSVTAWEG
jgi:hypothetical protein